MRVQVNPNGSLDIGASPSPLNVELEVSTRLKIAATICNSCVGGRCTSCVLFCNFKAISQIAVENVTLKKVRYTYNDKVITGTFTEALAPTQAMIETSSLTAMIDYFLEYSEDDWISVNNYLPKRTDIVDIWMNNMRVADVTLPFPDKTTHWRRRKKCV